MMLLLKNLQKEKLLIMTNVFTIRLLLLLLLFIIIACSLIYSCTDDPKEDTAGAIYSAPKAKNDWELDNYIGKVKSCTTGIYQAIVEAENVTQGDKKEVTVSRFDRLGNLIYDEAYFLEADTIRYDYHYVYDTASNPIEEFYGNERFVAINQYNSLGQLIECSTFEKEGQLYLRYMYSYNAGGQDLESKVYSNTGILVEKVNYLYDGNGALMEQTQELEEGKFGYRYVYKHDTVGNEIEKISYRFDGSIESKVNSDYDIYSNLVTTKGDGFQSEFEYNKKGNLVQEVEMEGAVFKFRSIYTYDVYDNLLKSDFFNGKGDHFFGSSYIYEYDQQGNWIKETKYNFDNFAETIRERTISYY
jgi:hypothetical protein